MESDLLAWALTERIIGGMPDEIRERPPSRLRARLTELHEGQEEDKQQFLSVLRPLLAPIPLSAIPFGVVATLVILPIELWVEPLLKPWLGGFSELTSVVALAAMIVAWLRWQRRKGTEPSSAR